MSAGILCADQVNQLISPAQGTTRLQKSSGESFDPSLVDLSSIDLPIGEKYWEMQGSCRTGSKYKVTDLIKRYAKDKKPKHFDDDYVTLKRHNVYLFQADCEADLSNTNIKGKATGKSSVGRLDVLVRLLVDESNTFDAIENKRHPGLYVEVTPISFDLKVKRGTALSQLRLYKGREHDISLSREELFCEETDAFPVLDANGGNHTAPCFEDRDSIWFPFRLNLEPDPVYGCSAFAVKKGDALAPIDPSAKNTYDPADYWEKVPAQNGAISLEPDRLYILRSKDRLRIPAHLALECKSYTTQMGEWRIEYAGFAHPYFGSSRKDAKGTPIIFEVRGHNVPTILTDEIPLGNVRFLRMSRSAQAPRQTSSYEKQELALSKCFKPWKK